ncbi:hypothetical protein HMPREF9630_02001 [Peptoanaerobacter stomatis]|uniref:HTH lacI-type domain-containing protein n=1 Tax=Peptoanaerobacter stomatis TaxID=796937 RepID=V9HUH8_9FIRM|nr:LacI family DNA-binding transcriptional regulator [Peptoanaerobacter stomatis]EHL15870.1 hypothetical protein HMPREF9630_02001 [Peptoanaerobacter stomatis]
MPVTIKDVARMSGVSISTVSRVINDSKPVSSNIRDRVFKVIEETGYVPNPVARSLVMKKSQLIGVITPGSSQYTMSEFLNGVEEIARMYEYDTILCNTYCESSKEIAYVDLLKSKQVAGIIFITQNINEELDKKLKKSAIPTVYYTLGTPMIPGIDYVDVDRVEAFVKLIEKVTDKDDRDIIYLRPEKKEDDYKESSKEEILKKALKKKNIKLSKCKIIYGADTVEKTYKLVESAMKKNKNIKSIISSIDEATLGSLYYLQDNGKAVPDDVKVAQVYETQITKIIRPGITSISLPLYDMGAVCARMIVKDIENREKSKEKKINEMILPYTLVERKSTLNN